MQNPSNCDLLVVYRISSGGYKKEKPDYITKESCLWNFVRCLQDYVSSRPNYASRWQLRVICDNCSSSLRQFVSATTSALPSGRVTIVETSHGNGAASFRDGLAHATRPEYVDSCGVYFVEDDYLHTQGAIESILEGLSLADFSTGYDHPDKYGKMISKDGNLQQLPAVPLVSGGMERGGGVLLGRTGHFRVTNSTTMTFASTAGTLRKCKDTISRWVSGTHPHDFHMWLDLSQEQGSRLVCTLPARSTHGETRFLAPHPAGGLSWETVGREAEKRARRKK